MNDYQVCLVQVGDGFFYYNTVFGLDECNWNTRMVVSLS